MHRPHHSGVVHRLPIPAVHVVPVAAKRVNIFHAFHELLCQFVSSETVERSKENRMK